MSTVFNDQDNEFDDNKVTSLDSIKLNRTSLLDGAAANKNYVDHALDRSTILRCNQTLQNYLEVSVGNTVFNLTE